MRHRGIGMLHVVAIVGLVLGIAFPSGLKARRQMALQSAADELRSILLLARMRAAERDREVGIRFVQIAGVWHHAMYDDGDGDGIRGDDVDEGIDAMALPLYPVLASGGAVVEHVNEPALCLFAPDGSASPCVISIVDDDGNREFVTQRRSA